MKVADFLVFLPPTEKERALGRLEGMEMAMRICRNRAVDMMTLKDEAYEAGRIANDHIAGQEAGTLAAMIRLVQVEVGAGRMVFGPLTDEEREEINRIY